MTADPDMEMLTSRIAEVRVGETECKAVMLRETLLPGQRLRITAPPALVELFTHREPMPIVLLHQNGHQQATRGVEATLEGAPQYRPVVPGIHPEGTADIVIAAHRVCDLLDDVASGPPRVSRRARVKWVELDDDAVEVDRSVHARAEALGVRVSDWIALVRRTCRERSPTHLEDVLTDLGPMPDASRPNARCLWIAGLINPLPALGASSSKKFAAMGDSVAPEIRPSVLGAATVEARLSCLEYGLGESMRRLQRML